MTEHDCLMESACGVTGFYCANYPTAHAPVTPRTIYCESEWHEGSCPQCGREATAPATEALDVERLAESIAATGYEAHPSDIVRWAGEIAAEYARTALAASPSTPNTDPTPRHVRGVRTTP